MRDLGAFFTGANIARTAIPTIPALVPDAADELVLLDRFGSHLTDPWAGYAPTDKYWSV